MQDCRLVRKHESKLPVVERTPSTAEDHPQTSNMHPPLHCAIGGRLWQQDSGSGWCACSELAKASRRRSQVRPLPLPPRSPLLPEGHALCLQFATEALAFGSTPQARRMANHLAVLRSCGLDWQFARRRAFAERWAHSSVMGTECSNSCVCCRGWPRCPQDLSALLRSDESPEAACHRTQALRSSRIIVMQPRPWDSVG